VLAPVHLALTHPDDANLTIYVTEHYESGFYLCSVVTAVDVPANTPLKYSLWSTVDSTTMIQKCITLLKQPHLKVTHDAAYDSAMTAFRMAVANPMCTAAELVRLAFGNSGRLVLADDDAMARDGVPQLPTAASVLARLFESDQYMVEIGCQAWIGPSCPRRMLLSASTLFRNLNRTGPDDAYTWLRWWCARYILAHTAPASRFAIDVGNVMSKGFEPLRATVLADPAWATANKKLNIILKGAVAWPIYHMATQQTD